MSIAVYFERIPRGWWSGIAEKSNTFRRFPYLKLNRYSVVGHLPPLGVFFQRNSRGEGIGTRFGPCVGYCFGVLNRPSLTNLNTRYGAVGDDVERSMRFVLHDGVVLQSKVAPTRNSAPKNAVFAEMLAHSPATRPD